MVAGYSVANNLVLNSYYKPPFANGVTVQQEAIEQHAEALVEKFDVRTPSVQTSGGSLSGAISRKW